MSKPDLAVLYWFYKEPEITKNHLELLRKHNPGRKIFGLYGGEEKDKAQFIGVLSGLLDDFWEYPGTYGVDSYSKWIHGDLLLLDWYDKRGRNLTWDSIAITQWDMLVFDDILNILPGLQKDRVYFAGYRTMEESVENRWTWTRPDGKHRAQYEEFCDFVDKTYGWKEPLKICLYLFEVLTRQFYDNYLKVNNKYIGMLEYKDPTLAAAWGMDIYKKDLGVYWGDRYTKDTPALIAKGNMYVSDKFIKEQLNEPDGWRIFHPNLSNW